jgi:hypothetical protein
MVNKKTLIISRCTVCVWKKTGIFVQGSKEFAPCSDVQLTGYEVEAVSTM